MVAIGGDLTTLQSCEAISHNCTTVKKHSLIRREHYLIAMTAAIHDDIEINNRERVVEEIARTSKSIRKKYRALKGSQIDEDLVLERQLKPIIEPLKQIAGNANSVKSNTSVEQTAAESGNVTLAPERNRPRQMKVCKTKQKASNDSTDHELLSSTSTSTPKRRRINMHSTALLADDGMPIPHQPSPEPSWYIDEEVFETSPDPLVTTVRRELRTSDGQEMMRTQFGKLGQKYVGKILHSDKNSEMDYVYGVYFTNDGMMLGDKHFDVDKDDNMIIGGVRYAGTPGIYELIFKRLPDDMIYTDDDKQKYRDILLATNAHRRNHLAQNQILGNKGYKYKHVIAPLLFQTKTGKGLTAPRTMTLSNNSIDYVYWNDPNELVDRLRLLEASHHAGNNAHNNEFQSIIEELQEAGIIIN